MRKKTLLAAAMAFTLIAAPLGGMNVSAEEGEDVSASEESQDATSFPEEKVLGTPYDLQFSEDLGRCSFSYPLIESRYGNVRAHVWVYRDEALVKEYDTSRDNSNVWNLYVKQGSSGSYLFQLPFYQDLTDSGSYYFEVRMEQNYPNSLAVSEKVTSGTVQYTRPEQTLGTTVGYWDTEKQGLFHYTSVEGAAGYEYRLYKLSGDQWSPCILRSSATSEIYTSIGHLSAFSNISSDSPRDAGGEDRTIDFTNDIFGNFYVPPVGSYCVTIKALSNNLNEVANGVEGEMSDVLRIETTSDSGQTDTNTAAPSFLEILMETAQPGEVIQLQDVTTLSSSEVRQVLDRGLTLEMEYTYEGVDYKVRIPAGASMDDSIPWYGPLYLAQYYGVSSLGEAAAAGGISYTVHKGDTLGRIARANNMTLAELMAKNPQIKNANVIVPGQVIQIQ